MDSTLGVSLRHALRTLSLSAGILVALANTPGMAVAQDSSNESKPGDARPAEVTRTFFLAHATQTSDLTDVQTDLRNLFPRAKCYAVMSKSAITFEATPDEVAQAQKVIAELDQPRKVYRLTYTITETEGGKATSTQHVDMVVQAGGKSVVKQGNRVPIVTGAPKDESLANSQQVQYLDVGLNIDATLDGNADSLQLRSRVEQSSVAEEKSGIGGQDPVIRQTQLDDVSTLTPGKAMVIGSLDLPDGTGHEQVEVVAEAVY